MFKKAIYAQAGIPVCWLVNLIEQRVEVYSDPVVGSVETADYVNATTARPRAKISLVLDDRSGGMILVKDLLF